VYGCPNGLTALATAAVRMSTVLSPLPSATARWSSQCARRGRIRFGCEGDSEPDQRFRRSRQALPEPNQPSEVWSDSPRGHQTGMRTFSRWSDGASTSGSTGKRKKSRRARLARHTAQGTYGSFGPVQILHWNGRRNLEVELDGR
jgi:hypothetical protein